MNTISLLPNKKRKSKAIEDLAVLPVFFKLDGKKVVLAGGTDASAWKAELMAAAGATVHIYSEELDPEFETLLQGVRKTQFVHHVRPWATDIFDCAAIAIADAESDGEAKAFYCAAKAAGVPVNVIDKPAFCEFQFGSIVNRSPAIVSISTNGVSPIMGQAIRRRVETLLPSTLTAWAQFAGRIRHLTMSKLEAGTQRRTFWEVFVEKAFSRKLTDELEQEVVSNLENISTNNNTKQGKVTLVGAGPGDAELLTLKAVRALQGADVILFDDLVSDDVLELARREAKRMLVGKRGGRESCKQEDINEMMISLAKSGKNVVRLKSGDPSIFGRAGEEITELELQNIAVEIVPGITSASAMAAQLGISLTHRDCAQSVRFVTGHAKNGKLPEHINWRAIADPTTTTIFYMGGRTAVEIKDTLISHGLSDATPVSICSSISRDNGKMWQGKLADINHGIGIIGYNNPVLIGVGDVFIQKNNLDIRNDLVSYSN